MPIFIGHFKLAPCERGGYDVYLRDDPMPGHCWHFQKQEDALNWIDAENKKREAE